MSTIKDHKSPAQLKIDRKDFFIVMMIRWIIASIVIGFPLEIYSTNSYVSQAYAKWQAPVVIAASVCVIFFLLTLRKITDRLNYNFGKNGGGILFGYIFILIVRFYGSYLFFDAGLKFVVRISSATDHYYVAKMDASYFARSCAGYKWFDPVANVQVHTCFERGSKNAPHGVGSTAIVHVLSGRYGISIVSAHSLDSDAGKIDIREFKRQIL